MNAHILCRISAIAGLLLLTACTQNKAEPPKVSAAEVAVAAARAQSAMEEGLRRAEAVLRGGETEFAHRIYMHLVKENPSEPRALIGLAETYLAARNGEKAYQTFHLVELDGHGSGRVLQGEGMALTLLGRVEEALVKLEDAVEADPSLWRAWNTLGQLRDRRGEWDLARHCYDSALAIAPSQAAIHNNLGVSLLMQGRNAEAASAFRAALQRDPTLETTKANLRLALAGQGRYREALTGLDAGGEAVAFNNVGFIALARGDLVTAETLLMDAQKKSPAYYKKASRNLEQARAVNGDATAP